MAAAPCKVGTARADTDRIIGDHGGGEMTLSILRIFNKKINDREKNSGIFDSYISNILMVSVDLAKDFFEYNERKGFYCKETYGKITKSEKYDSSIDVSMSFIYASILEAPYPYNELFLLLVKMRHRILLIKSFVGDGASSAEIEGIVDCRIGTTLSSAEDMFENSREGFPYNTVMCLASSFYDDENDAVLSKRYIEIFRYMHEKARGSVLYEVFSYMKNRNIEVPK
ncbi:hypothetical protein [Magnetospirillum fulvum]|uniref:hypothetical protein n=1 Tax=Magnetospirillum fulvum TaxID=1082 RepID=UPI0012DDC4E4|nr:hypothetical protein [Magnetospirillum fulvum]